MDLFCWALAGPRRCSRANSCSPMYDVTKYMYDLGTPILLGLLFFVERQYIACNETKKKSTSRNILARDQFSFPRSSLPFRGVHHRFRHYGTKYVIWIQWPGAHGSKDLIRGRHNHSSIDPIYPTLTDFSACTSVFKKGEPLDLLRLLCNYIPDSTFVLRVVSGCLFRLSRYLSD